MFSFKKTLAMPSAAEALPGRAAPIPTAREHFIFHRPLKPPYPEGMEKAMFGMGCFWGAERVFWELGKGIHATAVGYAGGLTPNPTYEEVCSGRTGHNKVVLVVFDPKQISYEPLLKTSGKATIRPRACGREMTRARNIAPASMCSRRRSAKPREQSKAMYARELKERRFDPITTEILDAPEFYYAEDYHQQYLAKNPMGYCGLGGTGVSCPIGLAEKVA